MDYSFIAYIAFCLIVGLSVFKQLNDTGRLFGGVLALVLLILIFVFYGQRWFNGTTSKFNYTGSWPPMINTCPDYLVYYKRTKEGKQMDTCIDMIGVSKNAGLTPWSQDNSPSNPPTDDQKFFNYVYKPGMSKEQMQTLCQQAQTAGLTWEGITNGESCMF